MFLKPMKLLEMNPYQKVEMWRKYRPVIPMEYWDDELYAEPNADVNAKVMDKKIIRAEARAVLHKRKYDGGE